MMATMEGMRRDLDLMRDEIARLKKINSLQNEEDLSLSLGESVMGQKLYDLEMELEEQKRSTAKITKLCMAAINSLERIEEKPGIKTFYWFNCLFSETLFQSSLIMMKVPKNLGIWWILQLSRLYVSNWM